jgi:hypothetical protein
VTEQTFSFLVTFFRIRIFLSFAFGVFYFASILVESRVVSVSLSSKLNVLSVKQNLRDISTIGSDHAGISVIVGTAGVARYLDAAASPREGMPRHV